VKNDEADKTCSTNDKKTVKRTSEQAINAQGGVVLHLHSFFKICTTLWCWFNAKPRPLYPQGKRTDTHCIGGWVDPRAGPEGRGKAVSTRIRSPDFQTVACPYTNWAIQAQCSTNNDLKNVCRFWGEMTDECRGLEDLGVDETIILKLVIQDQNWGLLAAFP